MAGRALAVGLWAFGRDKDGAFAWQGDGLCRPARLCATGSPVAPADATASPCCCGLRLPRAGLWRRVCGSAAAHAAAAGRAVLFVALKGPAFDGHDHVANAAAKGAVAALVSREVDGVAIPQIVVADTQLALAAWAWLQAGPPSTSQLWLALGVAASAGVVATILFFQATGMVRDNAIALGAAEAMQAAEVLFAMLLGVAFLGEAWPRGQALVGAALVVAGIVLFAWIVAHDARRSAREAEALQTDRGS